MVPCQHGNTVEIEIAHPKRACNTIAREEGASRIRVTGSVGKVPGTKGPATCEEGSDRLQHLTQDGESRDDQQVMPYQLQAKYQRVKPEEFSFD